VLRTREMEEAAASVSPAGPAVTKEKHHRGG